MENIKYLIRDLKDYYARLKRVPFKRRIVIGQLNYVNSNDFRYTLVDNFDMKLLFQIVARIRQINTSEKRYALVKDFVDIPERLGFMRMSEREIDNFMSCVQSEGIEIPLWDRTYLIGKARHYYIPSLYDEIIDKSVILDRVYGDEIDG